MAYVTDGDGFGTPESHAPVANPNLSRHQFQGDLDRYRRRNPMHPGVQQYEDAIDNGYMAHVEGLYQHARYIETGKPLGEPGKHGFSASDLKTREVEKDYDNDYADEIKGAIRSGTVDPVHVAMGWDISDNSTYGSVVPRNGTQDNDVWLGNGGHRLALARAMGVMRIPAKRDQFGTGDERMYGGNDEHEGRGRK